MDPDSVPAPASLAPTDLMAARGEGPERRARPSAHPPSRQSLIVQLRSRHGDPLQVDPRTGAVVAGMVDPPVRLLLLRAIVPIRAPEYLFLVAGDSVPRPISIVEDPLAAVVLSYVGRWNMDRINLQCPGTRHHVTVLPSDLDPSGRLRCDRVEIDLWEEFLPEHSSAAPSEFVVRLATAIEELFGAVLSARSVCNWLAAQPTIVAGACGAALVRLLPFDELDKIAQVLLSEGALSRLLTGICLGEDPAESSVTKLQTWERDRTLSARVTIGSELDTLGIKPPHLAVNASLPAVLRAAARSQVEPTRELCVIATARNEGIYFVEWIAHHRSIGVEHFFIYSNDNDDSSDELLGALADAGVITWIRNVVGPGVRPMLKAFTHALSEFPEPLAFRWAMILDLDEYLILNPARHRSLPDLLRTRYSTGATSVAFHWLMYVPGSDLRWNPAPMLSRFTLREPDGNRHVKTAFQTRYFISSMPHDPEPRWGSSSRFHKASGAFHHWQGKSTPPSEGDPEYSDAWVNHYFFKSVDEHVWKRSRGGGDASGAAPLSFDPKELYGHLHWRDASRATEDRNALHHLDGLKQEAARLRSLPAVSDAENKVRQSFQARISALRLRGLSNLRQDKTIGKADAEVLAEWLAVDGQPAGTGGSRSHVSAPQIRNRRRRS